jgi:hypothetical protein
MGIVKDPMPTSLEEMGEETEVIVPSVEEDTKEDTGE